MLPPYHCKVRFLPYCYSAGSDIEVGHSCKFEPTLNFAERHKSFGSVVPAMAELNSELKPYSDICFVSGPVLSAIKILFSESISSTGIRRCYNFDIKHLIHK